MIRVQSIAGEFSARSSFAFIVLSSEKGIRIELWPSCGEKTFILFDLCIKL